MLEGNIRNDIVVIPSSPHNSFQSGRILQRREQKSRFSWNPLRQARPVQIHLGWIGYVHLVWPWSDWTQCDPTTNGVPSCASWLSLLGRRYGRGSYWCHPWPWRLPGPCRRSCWRDVVRNRTRWASMLRYRPTVLTCRLGSTPRQHPWKCESLGRHAQTRGPWEGTRYRHRSLSLERNCLSRRPWKSSRRLQRSWRGSRQHP